MQSKWKVTVLVLYICSTLCFGQRSSSANTEFLLHESSYPGEAKRKNENPDHSSNRENAQVSGKLDYVSQFPALGKPFLSTANPNPLISISPTPNKLNTPSGIRNYVSPQFTTQKPSYQNSVRVKDVINFYDSKKDQSKTPRPPSYSSIVQGPNHNRQELSGPISQPVTSTTQIVTTKKSWSFSDIFPGSNKPTAKPPTSTIRPDQSSSGFDLTPAALPSAILNGNRNQGSGFGAITDTEIQTLSEELLRKDTNNAAKFITVNYQQKTTSQCSEDKAPLPLVTIQPDVWRISTISKFVPLLDNYEKDTMVNEYVTPQERTEENAFMDAIMSTSVIRHLMNFLKEKGHVTPDPRQQRDFLKQLWFSLYSRGKGKISSSGFEHVFVSEIRNQDVLGLHNWIYFAKEEAANRANYLGYLKYSELSDKGVVMKLHFNQQGVDKPVNSMFIGTSPELEMALYTVCFVTRADNDCKLKLAGKDVNIVTHTFRYRSKNLIGSAYPQI